MKERFFDLGPTPRLCLEFDEHHAEEYREARKAEIFNAPEKILAFSSAHGFEPCSKYCLLRRPYLNKDMWNRSLAVSSPAAAALIFKEFMKIPEQEFIAWWSMNCMVRRGQPIRATLFKHGLHRKHGKSVELTLVPMFLRESRYHLCDLEGSNSHNPRDRDMPPCLVIPSTKDTVVYDYKSHPGVVSLSTERIKEDVYYRPVKSNDQVGIDAFIVHGGHLYLLQYTVGKSHSIKTSLRHFIKNSLPKDLPAKDKWVFVFGIPDSASELGCTPSPDLEGLYLCTAKVPLSYIMRDS